jgi:hypothetical protein
MTSANELDAALEGRSPAPKRDTDATALVSAARSLRDLAATDRTVQSGGEQRALIRLRATLQAQRSNITPITARPAVRAMPLQPAFARVAMAAAVLVVGAALVAGSGGLAGPMHAAARTLGLSSPASVKVEAPLGAAAGDPLASGKAKAEQRTDRTRFAIEVEDVSTSGPHAVHISRSGAEIALSPVTLDVNALGFGELELNTLDGATNVPVALTGDLVEVMDPNGNVILSGTLQTK